jgi:Na+-translocating ferredoxin:NAD+ oxidoreductase RnfD subunit
VLAFVRTLITGHPFFAEVAPITGPMYQLFIFFMITDPKTTMHSKTGQIVVAFLVAVAEMMFRLAQNVDAPYYALTLVGPIAMLIDIQRSSPSRVRR